MNSNNLPSDLICKKVHLAVLSHISVSNGIFICDIFSADPKSFAMSDDFVMARVSAVSLKITKFAESISCTRYFHIRDWKKSYANKAFQSFTCSRTIIVLCVQRGADDDGSYPVSHVKRSKIFSIR